MSPGPRTNATNGTPSMPYPLLAVSEEIHQLRRELAACRENNAAIATQLDQYRDERDDARSAFARLAGHFHRAGRGGWHAHISGPLLSRLATIAMREPPTGLEALREASDLVAERDRYQQALEAIAECRAGMPYPEAARKALGRDHA